MEAPQTKDIPACRVIAINHTGSHDEIGDMYRKLIQWAKEKNVESAGSMFTVFLSNPENFSDRSGEFEVCMPVSGDVQAEGDVTLKDIEPCTAASVVVEGCYERIPARYVELLAWLPIQGLTPAGYPREIYLKGPKKDGSGNPDEFQTEILIPVE